MNDKYPYSPGELSEAGPDGTFFRHRVPITIAGGSLRHQQSSGISWKFYLAIRALDVTPEKFSIYIKRKWAYQKSMLVFY